jgi:hypothetical protein
MMGARWIRVSVYVASTLAALTVAIGLLHMPFGRPLLARLGVGCPVQASPEDVERARLDSAHRTRGTEASPAQPALGFVLDKMTIADAEAWADRQHVSCDEIRSGSMLSCKNVPETALSGRIGGPIDDLELAFSPTSKRLVNISTTQFGLDGTAAATQMSAVVKSLKEQLGKPQREVGKRSANYLASAPLRTALVRYRFTDYQADVSATNFPGRGMMLSEHYMSARD